MNVKLELLLDIECIQLWKIHNVNLYVVCDEVSGYSCETENGDINTDVKAYPTLNYALQEWKRQVKEKIDMIHF